jgi:hypothetical protein
MSDEPAPLSRRLMAEASDTIREHIYAEKLRQLRQQLSETFDEVERSEILRQVEEVEAEIERTSRGAQD